MVIWAVLFLVGLVIGILLLARAMPQKFTDIGHCPSCHLPLTQTNMTEGSVCLDERFYCDDCKRKSRCGC